MGLDTLALAEQVERGARDIYRALAARFADDTQSAAVFSRLAAEEEEHANRIQLLRNQYMRNPELIGQMTVCCADLEHLIARTRDVLATVESEDALTVAKATQLLAQLERELAGVHAHLIAESADPSIKQFFEFLATQDRQHEDLLRGS